MFFTIGLDVTHALTAARGLVMATRAIKSAVVDLGGATLNGLVRSLRSVGDTLWKLPQQAQALSGMLQGLSGPLKAAADMEELEIRFQTMTGSIEGAAKSLGELRRLADASSYGMMGLTDAAGILLSFAEPLNELPKTIAMLGDVAAGDENKLKELALLYGQARANGKLYTQDLMQLALRGIPAMAMLSEITGKNAEETKKMVEAGEVGFGQLKQLFKTLTEEGGRFQGMTAAMAATTKGRFSTLMDSWQGLQLELGKPINASLNNVMERVGKLMDSLKGKAGEWGEKVAGVVDYLTIASDQGRLGEVISVKLKLAGMEFIDIMVKGFQYAAEYMSVKAEKIAATIAESFGMKKEAEKMSEHAKMREGVLEHNGVTGQAGMPASSGLGKILYDLRDQNQLMDAQIALGVVGLRLQREKERAAREAAVNQKQELARQREMTKLSWALGVPHDVAPKSSWTRFGETLSKLPGKLAAVAAKVADAVDSDPMRRATRVMETALQKVGSTSGAHAGGGMPSGGFVGGGGGGSGMDGREPRRRGSARTLGRTEGLMMQYQQADRGRRGTWAGFVQERMGSDFSKLGDKERAVILAANPGGKAKDRMGREAERRAASDRAKATAAGTGPDDGDKAGQRRLAVMEKYLPELAKLLKKATDEDP